MKITFVLPMCVHEPVGGFKIVYEYANRLSERGHEITVLHRHNDPPPVQRREVLRQTLLPWTRVKGARVPGGTPTAPWFAFRPEVCVVTVPEIIEGAVPDADAVVATAWETAPLVSAFGPEKGRKYYFIQHDEACFGSEEAVNATWRLPLHKIVIARWLAEKAERMGEAATQIPNSLDFTKFGLDTPLAARPARIGMLYHAVSAWKGGEDGLAALAAAKLTCPDLQAVLFGTHPRDATLPAWIKYEQQPSPVSLRALYNRCSIFLQPSWTEGWGLTATEAMACGCALVTTDNGGSRDYAEPGITALVAPPKQPAALAEQLERLLQDDTLRQKIALAGQQYIQRYTWPSAVAQMESVLS